MVLTIPLLVRHLLTWESQWCLTELFLKIDWLEVDWDNSRHVLHLKTIDLGPAWYYFNPISVKHRGQALALALGQLRYKYPRNSVRILIVIQVKLNIDSQQYSGRRCWWLYSKLKYLVVEGDNSLWRRHVYNTVWVGASSLWPGYYW